MNENDEDAFIERIDYLMECMILGQVVCADDEAAVGVLLFIL